MVGKVSRTASRCLSRTSSCRSQKLPPCCAIWILRRPGFDPPRRGDLGGLNLRKGKAGAKQRQFSMVREKGGGCKCLILMVPKGGVEPPWPQGPRDFESRASASSATSALLTGFARPAKILAQAVAASQRMPNPVKTEARRPRNQAAARWQTLSLRTINHNHPFTDPPNRRLRSTRTTSSAVPENNQPDMELLPLAVCHTLPASIHG
jgi:hypothetical protein